MGKLGHCSICMTDWVADKEDEDCPDCGKQPLPKEKKPAEKKKK